MTNINLGSIFNFFVSTNLATRLESLLLPAGCLLLSPDTLSVDRKIGMGRLPFDRVDSTWLSVDIVSLAALEPLRSNEVSLA